MKVYCREWRTFTRGGQDFDWYRVEAAPRTHPARLPTLDAAKLDELKELVRERTDHDIPVVLVGFSAGAYLAMTAARELLAEGVARHRLALVALGHSLFPFDRWGPSCDVPGIAIIGELEQLYAPFLDDLSLRPEDDYREYSGGYVDLGDLPGGVLFDEVGVQHAFGGCAGSSAELHHLRIALPSCLVFEARQCAHNIKDYTWAVRYGQLRQVVGPGFASTRTCSTRSSLSSLSEPRSLSS